MKKKDVDIKKVDSFLTKIGLVKSLLPEHREEGVSHKAILSSALQDLEKEMKQLLKDKKELKRNTDQIGTDMYLTQRDEKKLKKQLASLLDKESQLNSKKLQIQEKLEKLKFRMSKVSKIKDELKEL